MRNVMRFVAGLALLQLQFLILLGCVGLGGLIGFGLAELSSGGNLSTLSSFLILSAATSVFFPVLKWFGLCDPRGLMVALIYSGVIMEIVWRASETLHRPWWIAFPLGVVCVVLGLVNAIGPPSNLRIEPGDHIPFITRIMLGDRNIEYLLAMREVRRRSVQELQRWLE